ncbi:hypothetical protein AB1Y20_022711 [Prymnesium parvum]|uniref:WD repeat-containing protein 82 n=1 Tax=Prymnesium parvum TaxID=97485 RepID=A0AB34JJL4_PRYPA
MVAEVGIGRVLREHTAQINAIDFSHDGELLASSADDGRLCLYSCQHGSTSKTTNCSRHGCRLVRFTHDPYTVLVASAQEDGEIRYLSLHDDRYLRYFKAHTKRVVSLELSPKEDLFASAALDDTARIWDLRSTDCTAVMRFASEGEQPAVAFDPQGVVLAAACAGQTKLFDLRAYASGPFLTFPSEPHAPKSFSCIKFSSDGKMMLQCTAPHAPQPKVLLLDAFKGNLLQTFVGHDNSAGLPLEASFSADSDYVLAGSEDGSIWRWHTRTGLSLPVLKGHPGPVTAVKCSPTRMMMASACSYLCLWL